MSIKLYTDGMIDQTIKEWYTWVASFAEKLVQKPESKANMGKRSLKVASSDIPTFAWIVWQS